MLDAIDELSIMSDFASNRAYLNMNTASAPHCTAEGPGLSAGVAFEPARFTVTCRSEENEEATRGGAPVHCSLVDANGAEVCRVAIKDLKTGQYECEYISPLGGDFVLNIMINTTHIKDSPFHPKIEHGEPSPGQCTAHGPAIVGAVSGVETHFTIVANV
jgi:hypothetical protein